MLTKDQLDTLKEGDTVVRMLAGEIPTKLKVTAIDEFIRCGAWTFHRETGCEVDMRFGWDGITVTGSFLTLD